jgi:hypothetical protein
VDGAGEFHPAKIRFGGAAVIHRLKILHAFSLEPASHFEGCDHGRSGSIRDVRHVSDVIAMSVRNENEIGRDALYVDFAGERIRRDERIEEEGLAASLDSETGVAVVGEFH